MTPGKQYTPTVTICLHASSNAGDAIWLVKSEILLYLGCMRKKVSDYWIRQRFDGEIVEMYFLTSLGVKFYMGDERFLREIC